MSSSGKKSFGKWSAGAALCLALAGYLHFSITRPGPQQGHESGDNKGAVLHDGACHAGCSHNHRGQGAYTKPPSYPEVTLSHSVVVGSRSIYESKPGDRVELNFGDNLVFDVRVKVNKTFPGRQQSVNMQILGRKGWVYWLEKADGSIMGNIVLKEDGKNIIYEYSGQEGDWTIQQISQRQYVCSSGETDADIGVPEDSGNPNSTGQAEIIPLLNSLPGAEAVVYIDFDGEVVSGTRWVNGGTINAEPSGLDEQNIRQFWELVSEDMRPFKINVTTDRAVFDAAAQNKKMMCIVTPTRDAAPSAGGVAYFNSFYDGSVDPCWCFVLNRPRTVSHEIGHTFGLEHDGLGDLEYHPGNGTWGPIMGSPPFNTPVTSWSDGNYEGSTNTEDDLAIIDARSANFRDDQYGDTAADAYDLAGETGEQAVGITGVIETPDDVDVFSFTTRGGSVTLAVEPEGVAIGGSKFVTNMNVRVQLYNEAGDLLAEDDPDNSYSASITTELEAGNYTFHVEGANSGSPDISGFSDYGSIGQYGLTGDVEGLGGLIVEINQPQLEEVSIAEGNGLVVAASVIGGADSVMWRATGAPSGGVVTFDDANSKSARASFSAPGLYTLRFRASLDPIFTDKELKVSVERPGTPREFDNRGPQISITSPEEFYARDGQLRGNVNDDGVPVSSQPAVEWVVKSGTARVLNPTSANATVRFRDNQPSVLSLESSDGQIRTFQQVTVRSLYEIRELITAASPGRWAVPTGGDDFLGSGWAADGFDDSAWAGGTAAIGYAENNDFSQYLISGTNTRAAMKGVSPSACVRIRFTLPDLAFLQDLKLRIHYNDAFVAYLNGVEVARRNLSGPITWDTTALSSRSLKDLSIADEINLTASIGNNLRAGENVLAIHGLNNASDDARFLIHPVLQAGVIGLTYKTFANRYGPNIEALGDDDGDGLLNFVEHALGTNPLVSDALEPLVFQPDGSIKISLPEKMPDDVDYILEQSEDLSRWAQIASKNGPDPWVGVAVEVVDHGISDGRAVYAITPPSPLPPKVFYRLKYRIGSLPGSP